MRKLFLLTVILCSFGLSQSNNVDTTVSPAWYFRDTLTASIDTIDVLFANSQRYSYHTVLAYTSAGDDTVDVYTLSLDELVWSRRAVIDETSGETKSSIIISTTPKEYIIFDSKPHKIRFVSNSNDASTTIFLLGIKK